MTISLEQWDAAPYWQRRKWNDEGVKLDDAGQQILEEREKSRRASAERQELIEKCREMENLCEEMISRLERLERSASADPA